MREQIKRWVLRLLRVPPHPSIPDGAGDVRVFRAAPAFFRYRVALWALGQAGALIGLAGGLVGISAFASRVEIGWVRTLLIAGEMLAWAAYLIQIPLSLGAVMLDFEMRWYILSDRSLRIREGVWQVQEKTMTFANIQQISIRQNPLQRLLGISDVEVRTAGGGEGKGKNQHDGAESLHEAFFRGVDNAEAIRTAIQERVRHHRDAGLGDPDDAVALSAPHALAPAATGVRDDDAVAAARVLHTELRALHQALAGRESSKA